MLDESDTHLANKTYWLQVTTRCTPGPAGVVGLLKEDVEDN